MIGALAGDIIGSIYEGCAFKSKQFPLFDSSCRFTDDTVLTVAVADVLLHGGRYVDRFREYFRRYPHAGYGGNFYRWALSGEAAAYGSYGNGSAMRVSPVGWALGDLQAVLKEAKASAEPTHNHPEGVKGAQATSMSHVPAAMICFLESDGFEDAVRNAISLGGDTDTLACIAGSVAHAFYGVPERPD